MADEKIKISELEELTTLDGFFTIGSKTVDGVPVSYKVNLGRVQTAINSATTAATSATNAASAANTAASNANAKATLANTAASTANTAATNADAKATLANTAAGAANTAATAANTAASSANEKAALAGEKAGDAATAATRANEAAEAAEEAVETMEGTYAKKDGYYETMGVGTADNLADNGAAVPASFIRRPTAGSLDVADGNAKVKSIKGKTVKFNQLCLYVSRHFSSSDGVSGINASISISDDNVISVTPTVNNGGLGIFAPFASGHRLYLKADRTPMSSILIYQGQSSVSSISSSDKTKIVTTKNNSYLWIRFPNAATTYDCRITVIDLTDIFGAGNEPSSVEEFESWLAENVGQKAYYPYSTGELVPMKAIGIKTSGFNAYNHTTGKARLFGGKQYQISGTYTSVSYTDIYGVAETITPDTNGIFTPTNNGVLTVVGGDATTTCVHLVHSGNRNGEFEEYWEQTRNLDLSNFDVTYTAADGTSKVEGGVKRAGDAYDEQFLDRDERRISIVDLGQSTWSKAGDYFLSPLPSGIKYTSNAIAVKMICFMYRSIANSAQSISSDKTISANANYLVIRDSAYSDSASLKASLAGVLLYYELATPVVTPVTGRNLDYKVSDYGREELVATGLTAPLDAMIAYGMNAVDTIHNLPKNYVSATQAQPFTEQEKKQARANIGVDLNGTYDGVTVGTAKNLTGKDIVSAALTHRPTAGTASVGNGAATIKALKGNTIVWNQLVTINPTDMSKTESGITITDNRDGSYTVNGTATADVRLPRNAVGALGHKCLLRGCPQGGGSSTYYVGFASGLNYVETGQGLLISSYSSSSKYNVAIVIKSGATVNNLIFKPQFFDLTEIFGAGNEPSTVEEFEALFPNDYYPYNAGELLSCNGTGIKTDGFNQWDEEWELGYYLHGVKTTSNNICSNLISCFPSTKYYFNTAGFIAYVTFYDADRNYIPDVYSGGIPSFGTQVNNGELITPAGAFFMTFNVQSTYGTTYNHDICINISHSGIRNGEYEPHWTETKQLPAIEGGWKSCGSGANIVRDEQVGTTRTIRVGSRAYQEGDENDTTLTTDGTTTYYPLATPIVTEVEPLGNYREDDFGTETLIPENGDEPTTSPIIMDVQYPMNAVDTLRNLPQNYQSQESMDAALTALGTALGFTFTKTWDATNGKWTYAITRTTE